MNIQWSWGHRLVMGNFSPFFKGGNENVINKEFIAYYKMKI